MIMDDDLLGVGSWVDLVEKDRGLGCELAEYVTHTYLREFENELSIASMEGKQAGGTFKTDSSPLDDVRMEGLGMVTTSGERLKALFAIVLRARTR